MGAVNNWIDYCARNIALIYLGMFAATAYCFGVSKVAAYPPQWSASAFVVIVYVVWWECANLGWGWVNSLIRSIYFAAGASVYLFIDMQWVIDRVFFFFVAMFIPLLIGVLLGGEIERK